MSSIPTHPPASGDAQQQQQQLATGTHTASETTHQQQQQQHNSSLTSIAQNAMMNAALSQQAGQGATIDMASVLAKIQQLEREKNELAGTLQNTQARLGKLQEGKRAEMEAMMNNTITKWLDGLETRDTTAKEQLRNGLNKLVQDGNESGVWEVVACASAAHIASVNQIETLTNELNSYREKERQLQGGLFASEESRIDRAAGHKRKVDEAFSGTQQTGPAGGDIWAEFQDMVMSRGGIQPIEYVPGAGGPESGSDFLARNNIR